MENQQLCNLKEDVRQLILTATLGDGHLTTPKTIGSNSTYLTNCKYLEYLKYKYKLLGKIATPIKKVEKNGYSQKPIYTLRSLVHPEITKIRNMSIEEAVNGLNEFGIALWFYDDGSLHKDKLFYNLNTHKFSKEVQETIFIPFFKKWGIIAKTTKEVKRDGRIFYYLRISKYEGAYIISEILNKYYISCYSYKVWSSETSQQWRKLQVQLKHMALEVSHLKMGKLLKLTSSEDMVRSLKKFKASRWYKTRVQSNVCT